MSDDKRADEDEAKHEEFPALPRHLSALIGSLRGPPDLGRNHDKHLAYNGREDAGGCVGLILCDTGPLVAAFSTADRDQGRYADVLRGTGLVRTLAYA
jgi:hypothetical protein